MSIYIVQHRGAILLALLFFLVVVVVLVARKKRSPLDSPWPPPPDKLWPLSSPDRPWPFYAKRPLTQVEQVLYHRLVKSLPEHIVLAQVQVSRVLGVKRGF